MKGKQGMIAVNVLNNDWSKDEVNKIEATIFGCFGLHKNPAQTAWVVTHIPTGRAAAICATKAEARQVAVAAAESGDYPYTTTSDDSLPTHFPASALMDLSRVIQAARQAYHSASVEASNRRRNA